MLVVDEIVDAQVEHALTLFDIPDPGRLVSRTRDQESAVSGKVQRVNLLHVALKQVLDSLRLDVPYLKWSASACCECGIAYPDLPVLRTGGQELAIGAEAYTSDVQISRSIRRLVQQHTTGVN